MTYNAALLISVLLAIAQPIGASGTAERTPTIAEAMENYRANRVSEAENQLRLVADDPRTSGSDRATALADLGRMDWLLRGRTTAARAALSDQTQSRSCAVRIMALRIVVDQPAPNPILSIPSGAPIDCSASQTADLQVLEVRARMAIATAGESVRDFDLTERDLDALPSATQRLPEVAGARLTLGIAMRSAEKALRGWRDYFWLDTADAPSGLKSYAGRVQQIFEAGLRKGAAEREEAALAMLLVRAGFVEDAATLAHGRRGPAWRIVNAGISFDRSLSAALLKANRAIAAGDKVVDLAQRVAPSYDALVREAGLTGDREAAMLAVFGIFGTEPGETDGYPSIHVGRLVQDESMRIAQYGRSGEVRFVVLDNMISNGFEGWLWDGWGQTGGWSNDSGTIVQVRSAYVSGTIGSLKAARPGAARDEYLSTTDKAVAAETAALRTGAVGPLSATSRRLKLQAIDEIARKTGDDTAFLAEVWRGTNQTSIESHEGRHALDHAELPNLSSDDLEYRAKLSQIIFADYPRLGLASVAGGALADTAHGRSDRHVLEGYRAWMRTHASEVAGFRQGSPELSQLTLLTNKQIVDIARGLDPWASDPRPR